MAKECGSCCCAVCRFGCYSMYQCCCCVAAPPSPPVFDVICIGITNAGKTTLLTVLANENPDTTVSTVGFSIKDIRLPNALLRVTELGGGENIRSYWNRYYDSTMGVIFVVDGMCTHQQLEDTKQEIHQALKHPSISSVPWLILCNKQDLEGACTHERAIEELQLRDVVQENSKIIVKSCSKTNKDGLFLNFESFADLLLQHYRNQPQGV